MSEPGSDIDNAGDAADNVPVSDPVPPSHPFLTEDQFQRWMASQRPPVPEPHIASGVDRQAHALSDYGQDDNDLNLAEFDFHAEARDEALDQPIDTSDRWNLG